MKPFTRSKVVAPTTRSTSGSVAGQARISHDRPKHAPKSLSMESVTRAAHNKSIRGIKR